MSRKAVLPLACQWSGCPIQGIAVDSPDELVSHVNSAHIESFSGQDVVMCMWEGCKVYNVPSSSYKWLKQHVQQVHMKERPHKCFMNGCNMSFHSVDALQRHLHRHLEPTTPKPIKGSPSPKQKQTLAAKTERIPDLTDSEISKPKPPTCPPPLIHVPPDEDSPPPKKVCIEKSVDGEGSGSEVSAGGNDDGEERKKTSQTSTLTERKGSAIFPFRRQRQSSLKVCIPRHALLLPRTTRGHLPCNGAHIHSEILDHKTMSVIRQTASHLAITDHTHGSNCITLSAMVLGTRVCPGAAERELLVRWIPSLISDSWVPLSKFQEKRVVPFKQLSHYQLSELATTCFGFSKVHNRQRRRKP